MEMARPRRLSEISLSDAQAAYQVNDLATVQASNGSTIHDTGAGEWECFPKRPCTNFSMLEVGA